MEYQWAEKYPELQRTCKMFQIMDLTSPKCFSYTPVNGILQDGPQCGLVALTMCIRSSNETTTVSKLFENAKKKGYTCKGEIFDVKHMHSLAVEYLKNEVTIYDGFLYDDYIKGFLRANGMLLVPYDCDKNHSPCCLKGQKAHWAVIVGCVETDNSFYVIARHGKSSHVAIWLLLDLAKSNQQLEELSNKFSSNYVLPRDHYLLQGLKNKSLLIWPLTRD